ncbi:MAG: hypothetical protein ABSF77_04315 [Spirochaetia bacterium]|jgi:hypothetical protein
MTEQDTLKTLQLFYAGLMVDAACNYEHFHVTEEVSMKKQKEQALAAPAQLAQLGIRKPAELFERFGTIFGCAQWGVAEGADGAATAETASCLACAIAKKRGSGKPCDLFCINPFRGMAQAMQPARSLRVDETLWEGNRCRFQLR